jgi:hypothetical protein
MLYLDAEFNDFLRKNIKNYIFLDTLATLNNNEALLN